MLTNFEINKNNVDIYLNELAKELKKLKCRNEVELILVGGSSVLINYSFRCSSMDYDGYYNNSILKDASNRVADRLGLPNGLINDDFINTSSYTEKIFQYSTFYKTFQNILNVRTITREYLIAMKLVSFRNYKSDISDIVGILVEDKTITKDNIIKALINLYGNNYKISNEARSFLDEVMAIEDLELVYRNSIIVENNNKEALIREIKSTKK